MLLTEFMLNSLSADKMSDIIFDRFNVNVYEYKADDMSLMLDTSDLMHFNMTPKELDAFLHKFGWYVSGYNEKKIFIRQGRIVNTQQKTAYANLYLRGCAIGPLVCKRKGLRAQKTSDLTDDPEDFKIGPVYNDKRNYIWDISAAANDINLLAHYVELAREYGKYVYLVKLDSNVYKDPEYEYIDEPACFIDRTILPQEILACVSDDTYLNLAIKLDKIIKNL